VFAGRAEDADVRIVDARLTPEATLIVRLEDREKEHTLSTQLIGLHWETAVALAFAAATRLGADPERAARAIAECAPSRDRLELVQASGGGRFLADTSKGTEASWDTSLAALAAVPARRRIAVIGSLIDFPDGSPGESIARVTAAALAVAAEVKLYGSSARSVLPETLADPRVLRYDAIGTLSDELWSDIGPGDLVLVKGARTRDHLARVTLRATHDVRCRRDDCKKRISCPECPLLGPPLQ
jgi:UDP-N-acetylmuramoyl-tripeptide--D-alanyl-D-alanine ligase